MRERIRGNSEAGPALNARSAVDVADDTGRAAAVDAVVAEAGHSVSVGRLAHDTVSAGAPAVHARRVRRRRCRCPRHPSRPGASAGSPSPRRPGSPTGPTSWRWCSARHSGLGRAGWTAWTAAPGGGGAGTKKNVARARSRESERIAEERGGGERARGGARGERLRETIEARTADRREKGRAVVLSGDHCEVIGSRGAIRASQRSERGGGNAAEAAEKECATGAGTTGSSATDIPPSNGRQQGLGTAAPAHATGRAAPRH